MFTSAEAARIFSLLTWLLALGWLWKALTSLRGMSRLPDLTRISPDALPPLPPSEGPHVTVLVPACNEQESIQATLRSLLASTGLNLEIIAVDDRSTDCTGELIDRVAAENRTGAGPHRLQVIHITELPAGWLGKPHALSLAAERAVAPWLLFTDGDVVFHPKAVELSLRHALAQNADHFVLALTLLFKSNAEAAVFAALPTIGQWVTRLWKVADPRAWDFYGTGGFSLVRREVYERLGGFQALRMEVIEDARFGWMVKRAGFAQRVAVGPGLVKVRWVQGVFGIVANLEKNGFAGARYRVGLTLAGFLLIAAQVVWPLVALSAGGWATAAGLLIYASIALTYVAHRRVTQVPFWLAVFFAPATAILLFALLRSMVLTLVRNGVEWRGTHYPLDELRRHAGRGW
jgi:GT2 family glycosyltransferase